MDSDNETLQKFYQDLSERRAQEPKPVEPKRIASCLNVEQRKTIRQEQLEQYEKKAAMDRKSDLWGSYAALRGKRYSGCTLENYQCRCEQQRKQLAKVRGYADQLAENFQNGRGLTLFGPCGTGKDHLSAAICRQAVWQLSKRVLWVDGMRLFADLRDSFDSSKASEASIVDRYARAEVLAISDPLPIVGDISPFQSGALFRIIDARYSAMLPTIVTVNMTPADAEVRLGTAIVDRLRDSSLMIHCNWESFRKPKGA